MKMTDMTSKSSRLCVAVLAAFLTTAFAPDNQGLGARRDACVPDAFNSAAAIPDAARVKVLEAERADLSNACNRFSSKAPTASKW
jgi:hypothetical protein